MDTATRTCSVCVQNLPITEFHTIAKRGKPYTYTYCKPCHREYVRRHYRENKQRYVDKANARNERIREENRERLVQYLRTHPCVDCGERDLVVLQFDHVRGAKTAAVSNLVRRPAPWTMIAAEIGKCDVRCANCHVRRTAASGGWWNLAL